MAEISHHDAERLFAMAQDMMCIADIHGCFKHVNPAFMRVLGYGEQTLLARPFLDFVHPDDVDATLAEVSKLAAGQTTLYFENRYRCADGAYRWLAWTSSPCPEEGVTFAVARDVTAQKAAQQRLREQAALLDLAGDAILVRDLDDGILYWNRGAEETYGWTASQVAGSQAEPLLRTRSPVPPAEVRRLLLEEGRWEGELVHATRDGRDIVVASRQALQRGEDGAPHAVLEINRDVTARKRMEEELVAAREAALESSRLKSEFLASMSHEIRTPMNGIIGMGGLLLDTPLSPEQRDYAAAIHHCGESLLSIINDILDFSKIEAGHLDLEPCRFDLQLTVEEVAGILAVHAAGKGLERLGILASLTRPVRPSRLLDALEVALSPATSPLALPEAPPSPLPPRDGGVPRVLVVEDNIINQRLTVALLTRMGCRADVAADGIEALHMADLLPYDVILMDCEMPGMDGYEATRRLREREGEARHTPVVAITAHALKGEREKCLAAGMDDYLAKPISPGRLREAVKRWIAWNPVPRLLEEA